MESIERKTGVKEMNEKEIEELRRIFLSRSSVELAVIQKLSTEILRERISKQQAIEDELEHRYDP
jgi:hypothetical protein